MDINRREFIAVPAAVAGALMAATHEDSSGNAVITDAAHDTITIQHVTAAQLLAHLNDFHFI